MNYIELGFWGITALFLVFGVIMGAVRGSNRSILRLILVLLSAVAAFFLRKVVANAVLSVKIGDVTIEEKFISMLGENFPSMVETAQILVAALASVVIFLVTFYLLKFLTWAIVYPLCKLFVKKGKKKHPIFGAFIGLVQGAVVALCICIPLAGLVVQTNKLMSAVGEMQDMSASVPSEGHYASADEWQIIIDDGKVNDGEGEEPEGEDPTVNPGGENEGGTSEGGENEGGTSEGGESSEPSDEGKGGALIPQEVLDKMNSFEKSLIGKFYGKAMKKPFTWISTVEVKVEDEESGKTVTKKYTLEDRVDTVVGAIKGAISMIKDCSELKDIDWNGKFDGDFAAQLQDIFEKLDETKESLPEDSIKIINDAAGLLIDSMKLPVDVDASEFDLGKVKFAEEGALIVKVVDVANKEQFTSEDLKEITEDLTNSTLVMPMLESVRSPMTLSAEKKTMVELAFQDPELNDAEKYDQDILETLRFVFGLSNGNGPDVPPPPQTPEISE